MIQDKSREQNQNYAVKSNKQIQVTVFGANGKVGSLVVEKALENGFSVVAFCHGNTSFASNNRLKIVQGNIYDSTDVDDAISGSDVVVSALGSWGTPNKDILTKGMKNIIPAMSAHKITRIVSLTGADAFMEGDKIGIIDKTLHNIISLFAKKIIQDGETHMKLLDKSGLDWTVIRSPVMNDKGDSSNYILTNKKPSLWSTINRSSVAQSMVGQINDTEHSRQALYIARKKS